MPDDVAENKFYLEVEKNYDLKKLFGEFLDSEEGQLYTRTDQSIRNNTNGQRNRKNIWNAFSNWTNQKELLDIELFLFILVGCLINSLSEFVNVALTEIGL